MMVFSISTVHVDFVSPTFFFFFRGFGAIVWFLRRLTRVITVSSSEGLYRSALLAQRFLLFYRVAPSSQAAVSHSSREKKQRGLKQARRRDFITTPMALLRKSTNEQQKTYMDTSHGAIRTDERRSNAKRREVIDDTECVVDDIRVACVFVVAVFTGPLVRSYVLLLPL
jgi:hypothetical protein